MTVREAIAEGKRALKSSRANALITTPGLDASLLLAEVMCLSKEELIVRGEKSLSENERKKFMELLERRMEGECVAYILGKKEFRGLDFLVNPSVLVPRPDTEILVEAVLEKGKLRNKTGAGGAIRVLDLCTGSGAIAVSLKKEMPGLELWAADISAEALETARANAERYQAAAESIRFYQGHLFEALPVEALQAELTFHVIVSNPPYIPSAEIKRLPPEVQREPRLALDGGEDGLGIIREIITRAKDYLEPQGTLLLEAGPEQMKSVCQELEKNRYKNIKTYKDLSGLERVIEGVRP
jgi:release factor glutamine methyltransferase